MNDQNMSNEGDKYELFWHSQSTVNEQDMSCEKVMNELYMSTEQDKYELIQVVNEL